MESKNYSENGLEIMITIVNREKADSYLDLLQSFEVNMQMSVPAYGAARPELLSKLDLIDAEKTVIFSVIRQDQVKYAFRELREKFTSVKNGNGISFTVPMSSVIGVSVFGFLSNNTMTVREDK